VVRKINIPREKNTEVTATRAKGINKINAGIKLAKTNTAIRLNMINAAAITFLFIFYNEYGVSQRNYPVIREEKQTKITLFAISLRRIILEF
jgi:hypothetical protein